MIRSSERNGDAASWRHIPLRKPEAVLTRAFSVSADDRRQLPPDVRLKFVAPH
jgi:hypothetical protein